MPGLIPNAPPDSVFGSPVQTNALSPDMGIAAAGVPPPYDPYQDDAALLEIFEKVKKESFENRWVYEKDWLQYNYYVANRQWITYHPARREWVDKRLQKWIPRPVTNKMAETVQAVRTNLGQIQLQVKARPVGNDPQCMAAAAIADQMAPAIHEEHDMDQVMREADFWLIVTGSVVLQTSWDKDSRFNRTFIKFEQCLQCQQVYSPKEIVDAGHLCPQCGSPNFQPAIDPTTGKPQGEWLSMGRGKTASLSPFEWAVPPNTTRFDELPYIIRLRWREKAWFEANMPELVSRIVWEKSTSDRSLQLFKSLAMSNDGSNGSQSFPFNTGSSNLSEGITEYELWLKPTPDYPEGLVLRIAGEKSPIIIRNEQEAVPGPFPYKDIEGSPLFPFMFAQYEHVGGRLYGRSALSPLIQKQDQLNQLDSLVQLIIQRMANPIWIVPEGAGIEHFTGEPGLVMKWNPLSVGGTNAKPERIAGSEAPQSLAALRAEIIKDIEELSGAFDIIKGQKPTGIEAFSALQLLVERSQSRFTSVFQSRGEMYRKWFAIAIELERQFGPEQRVQAVVGPNRSFTFKYFQNAQLQGQITIQVEDGSNMPKTFLGKRAAIEQASQLMLLNPQDPEQRYALLEVFGLSDLVPTLNYHVQAALQIQDTFETWAMNPIGPSPLVWKPWFDAQIHWTERIKWLNGDRMKEILTQNPALEPLIYQHLIELQMIMMPTPTVGPDGKPVQGGPPGAPPQPQQPPTGGGGVAMKNSNTNSGGHSTNAPKGTQEHGPNQGPR